MKLRSRLSTGTSEVEIVNKEDIYHGSRNSSLAVGSADSDHHLACALLSLNGRIKAMARHHGRGTELANQCRSPFLLKPADSLAGSSLNFLETFMSLGTILLIVLIIILLGRAWRRPLLRDRLLWRGRPRPRINYRVDTGFARQDLSFLRRKLDSYASSMLSRLGGSPQMPRVNAEMKSYIEECLRCYQTCLSTAMGHLFGDR